MKESIKLFGKDIKLKTHVCSLFDKESIEVEEPYITIYVRTKYCNANCKFCIFQADACKFNFTKYKEILDQLSNNIQIRKIGIAGGEPMLNWNDFLEISELSRQYAPNTELSLNTNGFKWERFVNHPIFKTYDYVQISRHHYDDELNSEIMQTDSIVTSDIIKKTSHLQTHRHQVQFRCNLIKGYIDSKEEVFKFLDWSNEVGINDVGVVSLMPINQYSKDNFIYLHIKELIQDNFFLTKKWKRHNGGCECFNYVYLPEYSENQIRVYHKNTFLPNDINELLVFDGENLTSGFGGEIIY